MALPPVLVPLPMSALELSHGFTRYCIAADQGVRESEYDYDGASEVGE